MHQFEKDYFAQLHKIGNKYLKIQQHNRLDHLSQNFNDCYNKIKYNT